MQDEFTTEMHAEMLSGEISWFDMKVLGACGAMRRGLTKEEALKKYGLTEEERIWRKYRACVIWIIKTKKESNK